MRVVPAKASHGRIQAVPVLQGAIRAEVPQGTAPARGIGSLQTTVIPASLESASVERAENTIASGP